MLKWHRIRRCTIAQESVEFLVIRKGCHRIADCEFSEVRPRLHQLATGSWVLSVATSATAISVCMTLSEHFQKTMIVVSYWFNYFHRILNTIVLSI